MNRLSAFVVVLLVAGVWAANAGLFYQTGQQWYEACWEKRKASRSFKKPEPSGANQAAAWSKCESEAQAATYNMGFIFSGLPKDADDAVGIELKEACPSAFADVVVGGWYMNVVGLIEKSGGLSFVNRTFPARYMIEKVVQTRWPKCDETRRKQDYPRIVKKGDKWAWEKPCKPCSPKPQKAFIQ